MKSFTNSGAYLSDVRRKSGMTQMELAEMSGHHSQVISNAERGLATLPPDALRVFRKKVKGFDKDVFVSLLCADISERVKRKYDKVFKK